MKRNDRIIFSLALTLLVLFSYVSFYDFSEECRNVRENSVRLHILANSDSENDQRLKLMVRDEILKEYGNVMGSCKNRADAVKKLEGLREDIKNTSVSVLRKEHSLYDVNVHLENMYFDNRDYEDGITMPAGSYDALRIEIGEGRGKNWWCVMYPPLCIPVCCERDSLILKERIKDLRQEKGFEAKFAFVEFSQKFAEKLKNR